MTLSAAAPLWQLPRAKTLFEIVALPGERCPDAPALHFSLDGVVHEAVSWGWLRRAALEVAGDLRARGHAAGSPVMVVAQTEPAFFAAFFGVLAARGVPVPVAPLGSRRAATLDWYRLRLENVVRDTGAQLVLTPRATASALADCVRTLAPPLDVVPVGGERDEHTSAPLARLDRECCRASPGDLALLQYTSGSTSDPKGVALAHEHILANLAALAAALATQDASAVSWLPLHHDMGLIGAALTALYVRRPLLLIPPRAFARDPGIWLRAIDRFAATMTLAPNFAFTYTAQSVAVEDVCDISLASLRTILSGAEPVEPAAIDAFESRFAPLGLRRGVVQPVYGLAENVLAVSLTAAGERLVDEVDAEALEVRRKAVADSRTGRRTRHVVSVGSPLQDHSVQIVDDRDRPVADRRVGEVVVRGPSVMRGYHNRPTDSAEALRGGWLHTGDLGYLADGRLFITGRLKDLVIRHGRNHDPGDIEIVVGRVEGVVPGGVAAFSAGEPPAVVVVAETRLRDESDRLLVTRRIREACHEALGFGPDDVRLVARGDIPRTTSGKIRRAECRRRYLEVAASPNPKSVA